MSNTKVLNEMLGRLKATRSSHEHDWDSIRRHVHIHAADFYSQTANSNMNSRVNDAKFIYDGTAPWALEQFAAGLHSHLTNPSSRWFNLSLKDVAREDIDDEPTLNWLDTTTDILFSEISKAKASFNSSTHELYLDVGSFGTGIQYEDYNIKGGHLSFSSCPLADCWIQENHLGMVDTLFRLRKMTKNQILDKFGHAPGSITRDNDISHQYDIYHAVYPNQHRHKGLSNSTNMPYASFWWSEQHDYIFSQGGYNTFPYHSPRWTKLPGQSYGRAPAHTCLPDILMINRMSKVTIKGAEKIVDPPLEVSSDGFIMPISTSPGSLIYKEPGTDPINPLVTNARVDIGLEMQEQRREHIIKCFYVDWLLQQKNSTQMTATEVIDRREEKLRMMAPMIGRLESEFCSPVIMRSFDLLNNYGKIPEPTDLVKQMGISIEYSSPAAEAQKAGKALNTTRFLESIIPLIDLDPEVRHTINYKKYASNLAKIRDIDREVLNDSATFDRLVAQEREQQQQGMQIEQALTAAKATGELAKANAAVQSTQSPS